MAAESDSSPGDDAERAHRLDAAIHALERHLLENTRAREGLPVLTLPSVRVLKRLRRHPGMTPAELAESLQLARTSISESLGRLAKEGLVERRPSPTDGRSVRMFATDRALEVLASFEAGRARVMRDTLDMLPARERTRLLNAIPALELLRRAQESLREQLGLH